MSERVILERLREIEFGRKAQIVYGVALISLGSIIAAKLGYFPEVQAQKPFTNVALRQVTACRTNPDSLGANTLVFVTVEDTTDVGVGAAQVDLRIAPPGLTPQDLTTIFIGDIAPHEKKTVSTETSGLPEGMPLKAEVSVLEGPPDGFSGDDTAEGQVRGLCSPEEEPPDAFTPTPIEPLSDTTFLTIILKDASP